MNHKEAGRGEPIAAADDGAIVAASFIVEQSGLLSREVRLDES